MSAISLSRPSRSYDGRSTLATCTVSIPGKPPREMWIRTSGAGLVESADPFVALVLLPAMVLGVPVSSEGPVSRTLLESGLPSIQKVYSLWRYDRWYPRYRRFHEVKIDAPVAEDIPSAGGVGLFFSGGVDSSFSLVDARDEITHLIFIQDWEGRFPTDQGERALSGVANVAQGFGKAVITVETNAKSFLLWDYLSWLHFHGALLAAVALELQGRLSKVHVPATYDVSTLQPWGSHPYLDPLWSTTATEVVHDRIDVTRLEKLAAIADERLLMENLRVCGEPYHNCGSCEKCVRTMFTLQALGRYEQGLPFDRPPLTPREIARLNWSTREYPEYIQEVVDYLKDTGGHPELLKATRIAHSGFYYHGPGRLIRGNLGPRLRARAGRELTQIVGSVRRTAGYRRIAGLKRNGLSERS